MAKTNSEFGLEIQTKFSFYLIALVFTVLALSIQTGELTKDWTGFVEVASWVALLISGLCGLRRMEMIPEYYRIGDISPKSEQAALKQSKVLAQISSSQMTFYRIHKALFVVGLVLLIVSRANSAFH